MVRALALVFGLACLAVSAGAGPAIATPGFVASPLLEAIPAHGSCDVVVSPSNFTTALAQLNDPSKRVFCVQPGNYRSAGTLWLTRSGTRTNRRILRFNADDGLTAVQRSTKARFESIHVFGSWWVIQGLTFQPQDPSTVRFLYVRGGDRNVLDGNLVDGSSHANQGGQDGIAIGGFEANPAIYNTVQRNVVRLGNRSRLDVDFHAILIRPGTQPGESNDFNKVLDNEVYDWGDGIGLGGYTGDCTEPAVQRGNWIDGNDVYLTASMRVDCNSGAPDPNGECACAENGIETKANPGSNPLHWNRITNNRVWGMRPTSEAAACGGSGANGQAINAGNSCPGHVLVANNIVSDSTIGIMPAGPNWIIAGNLLHDIRASNGENYGTSAINTKPVAWDLDIQFNTIVSVDNSYDDKATDTDTRCNVVIDDLGLAQTTGPAAGHSTAYNFLYDSPARQFLGPTNEVLETAAQSGGAEYCYWRRRWTTPQKVCVPLASTTAASPHIDTISSCTPDLAAAFGVSRITWPTAQPCADGVDNDGDGSIDAADDRGCLNANSLREDPACQNGLDDDGDGLIDFDGGASANGTSSSAPDRICASPFVNSEKSVCGLGAELVAALWLLRGVPRIRRLRG